jgi:prepilin-type N-terminal cleavage/methylation domain-containing protein
MRRRDDGGFSLLEVMVSIAILAMALVVLARIVTSNVRATHHSRMMTAATFLARSKIAGLEQAILDYGFSEMDGEDKGDFTEEGYPHFRWYAAIQRVELPTDGAQKVQQAATQQKMGVTGMNPMQMLTGFMGGFMTTLMEPIRVGIQESVRRLTVKVMWNEMGRPDQSFEVVAFLTDPSKLDMALQGPQGSPNAGAGGAGGGNKPGPTGTGNPMGGLGNFNRTFQQAARGGQ